MTFSRYAAVVFGIVAGTLLPAWPFLGAGARAAVLTGAALATANSLAAYFLALWSSARSTQVFLGVVLGGMMGRLGALLAAVAVAIRGFGLPAVPLALSLVGYFIALLVLELAVLQRRAAPARPETR